MNTQQAIAQFEHPKPNAPDVNEFAVMKETATMLVKTGFLPQAIKTPEQAIAIILTGRELGIGTMAALNTINVIQGKPTVAPQLMLALIERSGQLENIEITTSHDGAVTCTMKRKGRTQHSERFGGKEASDMGLAGKDNYKKQAAVMYRWRAVAACARVVFPDVILGLYTPDEMGANVNEDGEVVTVPLKPVPMATNAIIEDPSNAARSEPLASPPTPAQQPASSDAEQATSLENAECGTGNSELLGQINGLLKVKCGDGETIDEEQAAKVLKGRNMALMPSDALEKLLGDLQKM